MSWVSIVGPDDAEGDMRTLYGELRESGVTRLGPVLDLLTHHPTALRGLLHEWPPTNYGLENFDQVLAECIAVVVSSTNDCRN
jgi:alkylhydroperoxidase family enzyme